MRPLKESFEGVAAGQRTDLLRSGKRSFGMLHKKDDPCGPEGSRATRNGNYILY